MDFEILARGVYRISVHGLTKRHRLSVGVHRTLQCIKYPDDTETTVAVADRTLTFHQTFDEVLTLKLKWFDIRKIRTNHTPNAQTAVSMVRFMFRFLYPLVV